MNDEGGEQKQDSASRTWLKHVSWLSFPTEYGNCYKCIWFRSEPSMGSWRLKCFFMVKKSRKRSFWSSERKEGLLVGEEAEKEEWRYPVWSAATWAARQLERKQGDGDQGLVMSPVRASHWSLAPLCSSDWLMVTTRGGRWGDTCWHRLLTMMVIILWAARPHHERPQRSRDRGRGPGHYTGWPKHCNNTKQ